MYEVGVAWIAANDDVSDGADGVATVLLLADLLYLHDEDVERDVERAYEEECRRDR